MVYFCCLYSLNIPVRRLVLAQKYQCRVTKMCSITWRFFSIILPHNFKCFVCLWKTQWPVYLAKKHKTPSCWLGDVSSEHINTYSHIHCFFLWHSDINYPGKNPRVFLVKWHKINLFFTGSLDLSRVLFSSWGFSHVGWSPLNRRAVKLCCRTAHSLINEKFWYKTGHFLHFLLFILGFWGVEGSRKGGGGIL